MTYCAVCDRDRATRLAFTKRSAHAVRSYDIVTCLNCGFRFVAPPPTDDELDTYYAAAFDDAYGQYVRAREMKKAHFRAQLGQIDEVLPGPGAHLLDVGCAAGFLLEVGLERGWDVLGVELNAAAVEHAADTVRSNIVLARAESLPEGTTFDVITLFDILEHAPDPRQMLAMCTNRLCEGGCVVVQFPSIDSRGARWMGRRWFHYGAPSHLSYFDYQTFVRLTSSLGLEVVAGGWTRKGLDLGYLRAQVARQLVGGRVGRLLERPLGRLDRVRLRVPMGERLCVLARQQGTSVPPMLVS